MNEPAAYLLDTNVVSEMMRPEPDQRVVIALQLAALNGVGIASVTVWEILNGIGRLDPGRRRSDLRSRFQCVLDEVFDGRVFAWTRADAEACANIMEAKRRLDAPLDDHLPDAMIAATAVTRRLTVLTRNESLLRLLRLIAANGPNTLQELVVGLARQHPVAHVVQPVDVHGAQQRR